ncbi:MAG TPA: DUF4307 domain-containing protein [Nocardioidaceae bacterium]
MTDLATRYGTPSTGRRRLTVVVAAVLAVVGVAWLGWAWSSQSHPAVTSDVVGFEVVDAHTATATFTVVRRGPEVEASCLLRAQAADHAIVGELNVTVGPGGDPTERRTETVRTDRLATTVDVVGCLAEGQDRRR